MKTAIECKNMNEIRIEIDSIDNKIVELIAFRSEYVKEAAKFKASETAVRDTSRVQQVINSKKALADIYGVSPELIGKIYSTMIDHFVNAELEEWNNKNT